MRVNKAELSDLEVLPLIAELFFVLTFALKAFTDGPYNRGEISNSIVYIKYATAFIACFVAFAHIIKNGETRFIPEFNKLMTIVAIFTMLSIIMQVTSGSFTITTYIELIKLAMPMVLAYCILNALNDHQIYACMVAILIISVAGYLIELKATGVSTISILRSDFFSSKSETESSGFSEIALMLSFYFLYEKRSNIASIVSVLFCILCFKRLAMLVVLAALMVSYFAPKFITRKVPVGFLNACKFLTLIACLFWCWLLLRGQENLFISLFGKSPFEFTMGRSESLRFLVESHFQSYGFGSSNDVIRSYFGVPFEMDLAKIAIELTPIALVCFVWLFWDLGMSNVWAFAIIAYFMLNMITSDSLTSNFSFTLAYIVIGSAGNCEPNYVERAVKNG